MSERPVLTDADLQEIVAEVKADGVWIAPSFATEHGLTGADEARIEEGLTALAEPVRVILVEPSYDDPEYQGDAGRVADAVAFDDPAPAIYLVPGLSADDIPRVEIKDHSAGTRNGFHAEQVAAHRAPDDLVERILETAELAQLSDKAAQAQYEVEIPAAQRPTGRSPEHDDEGVSVWLVSGLALACLVIVALCVTGWRRFVRSRSTYVPSASVLRRAKGAETRTRRQQAEAAALELSERIVAVGPVDRFVDAALAHHEAARRLLDREPTSSTRAEADVVGALVLLRRGTHLLTTPRDGEDDRSPVSCWFNPLHAPGRHQVTWRDRARTVDVPACDACERQVKKGREPDDILDLAQGSSTRHWFQLDLGVWTDTGFGAFSRDLPRDLNRDANRDLNRRDGR